MTMFRQPMKREPKSKLTYDSGDIRIEIPGGW
jgi:hypothetical protein